MNANTSRFVHVQLSRQGSDNIRTERMPLEQLGFLDEFSGCKGYNWKSQPFGSSEGSNSWILGVIARNLELLGSPGREESLNRNWGF